MPGLLSNALVRPFGYGWFRRIVFSPGRPEQFVIHAVFFSRLRSKSRHDHRPVFVCRGAAISGVHVLVPGTNSGARSLILPPFIILSDANNRHVLICLHIVYSSMGTSSATSLVAPSVSCSDTASWASSGAPLFLKFSTPYSKLSSCFRSGAGSMRSLAAFSFAL